MKRQRPPAILLLGPTGSGKTPLGTALARHGLHGRTCHHFDFGEQLRRLAEAATPLPGFTPEDVEFVRHVLHTGALLENETFHIAERLLQAFRARHAAGPNDWILLNGLPRHVGQADNVARILSVRLVLALQCGTRVVCERIRRNTGGDRTGRTDDDMPQIRAKLRTFRTRTRPLLSHYRGKNVPIIVVRIDVSTRTESLLTRLTRRTAGIPFCTP